MGFRIFLIEVCQISVYLNSFLGRLDIFKTPRRLSAACVWFEASTVELISINIAVSKCRIICCYFVMAQIYCFFRDFVLFEKNIFGGLSLVFFTFLICFLNLSDLVINTCLTAICRSVILVDQKENLIFVK